jgi:molecular chaperone GrpE
VENNQELEKELEEAVEETVETEEVVEETVEAEESTEETAETEEATEEGAEKKGFFGKKKDKKDKKDLKIEELEDKVKRQLAEFENFRNRTDKEKQAMFETGAKSILEKILPVIDNFERGFSTVEAADEEDAFVQGMRKVYKQMMDELDKIGVKPIEAVGQEFNPDLHNAVMQVESDEFESGIVAQEFMKGYTYRDTVVRYSMVGVVS